MAARKKDDTFEVVNGEVREVTKRINPASSPASREGQMINLAMNLAEKQLIEGTASSQVIVHFLKLGTEREKTEQLKLKKEVKLLEAKERAIETAQSTELMYTDAIEAMKRYGSSS